MAGDHVEDFKKMLAEASAQGVGLGAQAMKVAIAEWLLAERENHLARGVLAMEIPDVDAPARKIRADGIRIVRGPPITDFPWIAYRDGDDGTRGHGRTEEEAVQDFLELEAV